jgi:L-fuculose-phosphate aldolase
MYYTETEARKIVIEAGRRLCESKLVARTWGNISARISDTQFVITPSGRDYEGLSEEDLVVVGTDCSYEGDIKPSSEKGIHADAYALRSDVSFIIHTHQHFASAVAADCRDTDFAPCGAYGLPGTSKLRRNMSACMRDHPDVRTFLMARHGALLLGTSFEEAFDLASDLEEKCRALVEARVPSHDAVNAGTFDISGIKIDGMPYVRTVSDPYVMECCRAGISIGAYIDDFAQIVGPDIQVVPSDEWTVQRTLLGQSTNSAAKHMTGRIPMTGAFDRMGGQHPAVTSLTGRNAVLVKGIGAVCTGRTEQDAEAAAMITAKNCAAACYVRHARPLGAIDARLQRYIYLTSYSKRIDD